MFRLFFMKIKCLRESYVFIYFVFCDVWSMVATPLQQIWQDDLFKALPYIHGLVVDSVLDGVLFDIGGLPVHHFPIGIGHFRGLYFEMATAFQINEFCGSVGVVKRHFLAVVQSVEQQHFVFAVA